MKLTDHLMTRVLLASLVGLIWSGCAGTTGEETTTTSGASLSQGVVGEDDDGDGTIDENGEGKGGKGAKTHAKNDGVDNDADGTIDEHGEHVPSAEDGDADDGTDEAGEDMDDGTDEAADDDGDADEGVDEAAEDTDEDTDEAAEEPVEPTTP